MYGLVKKNDGTYALTEFVHYGKGHLDGGHSGRYPWGSGAKNGKDVATSDVRKYKNVRFRNGAEYDYTIGDKYNPNVGMGAGLGVGSALGGPLGGVIGASIGTAVGTVASLP